MGLGWLKCDFSNQKLSSKFLFKKMHVYQIHPKLTDKNVLQIVKISYRCDQHMQFTVN